jgi:hypothetical protein
MTKQDHVSNERMMGKKFQCCSIRREFIKKVRALKRRPFTIANTTTFDPQCRETGFRKTFQEFS